MKTLRLLLTAILCSLLLGGCMRQEIDDLRRDLAGQAERIATLERWAETVNTNISSLQTLLGALEIGDYITGITPIKEGGIEVGYTITFTASPPINIYHGQKGADGAKGEDALAPLIGIAQDPTDGPDGPYYWTLDKQDGSGARWITDTSGDKIPVTGNDGKEGEPGKDAVAPQIRINVQTNHWEISTDGGQTWDDTGIEATGSTGAQGPQGDKGDRGDAIFAENGVDNTSDDYVVFTLADGTTTITVPRYKPLGISFTQPETFKTGENRIAFATTGPDIADRLHIRITGLPQGWTASVDYDDKEMVITVPASVTMENGSGEALILLGENERVEAMYALRLMSTGVTENVLGGMYYEKGVLTGMVWQVSTGSNDGLILHKEIFTDEKWDKPTGNTIASNIVIAEANGKAQFAKIKETFELWDNFSALAWLDSLGSDWFSPRAHVKASASEIYRGHDKTSLGFLFEKLFDELGWWEGEKYNLVLTANDLTFTDTQVTFNQCATILRNNPNTWTSAESTRYGEKPRTTGYVFGAIAMRYF